MTTLNTPTFTLYRGPRRREKGPKKMFEEIVTENFPGGSDGKVFVYNAGDLGSIPGLGRSPGVRSGTSLNGQSSLVGYNPWGCKESNTTKHTVR